MKKIIKYTFFILAGVFAGQSLASAQEFADSIKLFKSVTQEGEGSYRIDLDAFVTGSSTTSTSTMPVDVALVLDVSYSMGNNLTVLQKQASANYSYNSFSRYTYYILYEGSYCQVHRDDVSYGLYTMGYYLYFDDDKGDRHYLKGQGNQGIWETRPDLVGGREDAIWSGELYRNQNVSKLNLLKNAVQSFIDIIAENAKGADNTANTDDDVAHRISIIKYASAGNQTSVVDGLKDVIGNAGTLKTHVQNLQRGTYTRSDEGMRLAASVLDTISRESSKIVVMFTDGLPNDSNDQTYFDGEVANAAITHSKGLKANDTKVYTIGIFDNPTVQVETYMNYVSSNYPAATSMTSGGTGQDDGYYQLSDGSDLTSIFEKIAMETTADVIDLHEASSALIDIVSSNFIIPEDVTADDIEISIDSVYAYEPSYKDIDTITVSGVKYYCGYAFNPDAAYYNTYKPTVVRKAGSDTVSVTGFDYARPDSLEIGKFGNWVGLREINGTEVYAGRKIHISFPIKLSPDYQGGYSMATNDIQSGIWVDGNLIKPFPVPAVDFPSISIVKHGMKVGESAIFKVFRPDLGETFDTASYTVVLTQKAAADGTPLPCYAVLKRLDSGEYTIQETKWSWMYDADDDINEGKTSLSYTIMPADQVGVTTDSFGESAPDLVNSGVVIGKTVTKTVDGSTLNFVMLKDSDGSYNSSAISILYEFGNVRNTTDKPARGEAWANNKFKGGTAKSGSTESGEVEEDDELGGK